MKNVAATNGQSVRCADFFVELLVVGLVGTCDAVLGVDNSYGFLLNLSYSSAAFNVRKISADARRISERTKPSPQRTQSFTEEDTEESFTGSLTLLPNSWLQHP
jgi:hypothetical protein